MKEVKKNNVFGFGILALSMLFSAPLTSTFADINDDQSDAPMLGAEMDGEEAAPITKSSRRMPVKRSSRGNTKSSSTKIIARSNAKLSESVKKKASAKRTTESLEAKRQELAEQMAAEIENKKKVDSEIEERRKSESKIEQMKSEAEQTIQKIKSAMAENANEITEIEGKLGKEETKKKNWFFDRVNKNLVADLTKRITELKAAQDDLRAEYQDQMQRLGATSA